MGYADVQAITSWEASRDAESARQADMRRLRSMPGVLVIDDGLRADTKGEAKDRQRTSSWVFETVSDRHDRWLPTIITTNTSKTAVCSAYGDEGRALVRRAEDLNNVEMDMRPEGGGWVDCPKR